jgi:uncharacterized protein YjbI with pentapeptide repeats
MTMADEEQLKILMQGVEAWNRWREENPEVRPDLSGMDLYGAHLDGANLSEANLSGAHLSLTDLRTADLSGAALSQAILSRAYLVGADLSGADLTEMILNGADLQGADLSKANLFNTNLGRADLRMADLSGANLQEAYLFQAHLDGADLTEAHLNRASLSQADLSRASLSGADLSQAWLGLTVLADLDLSMVKGLNAVGGHFGPSYINRDTLAKSRGQIPEKFLRGCGLSDWEIEAARLYQPDLSHEKIGDILDRIHDLRAHQANQVNSLFISYTRADGPFVDCLEGYLTQKGVRFWRDMHDATAGRLEKQIDRAMRLNPTVLLVLSAASVQSDWVEHEARLARELEKELGRDVLCPVALDDSWKTCRWPERLREQIMEYNILDFSAWQDGTFFRQAFGKLIDGLDLFYKGE